MTLPISTLSGFGVTNSIKLYVSFHEYIGKNMEINSFTLVNKFKASDDGRIDKIKTFIINMNETTQMLVND